MLSIQSIDCFRCRCCQIIPHKIFSFVCRFCLFGFGFFCVGCYCCCCCSFFSFFVENKWREKMVMNTQMRNVQELHCKIDRKKEWKQKEKESNWLNKYIHACIHSMRCSHILEFDLDICWFLHLSANSATSWWFRSILRSLLLKIKQQQQQQQRWRQRWR